MLSSVLPQLRFCVVPKSFNGDKNCKLSVLSFFLTISHPFVGSGSGRTMTRLMLLLPLFILHFLSTAVHGQYYCPVSLTLNMRDSYGDGWNSATWTATGKTTGNIYGPYSIASGSTGSATFSFLENECITIVLGGGSFMSECSWDLVYTSAPDPVIKTGANAQTALEVCDLCSNSACPPGQYQDTAGQNGCQTCGAGSITNTGTSAGATTCTPCAAGLYSLSSGVASCATCGAGGPPPACIS